MYVRMEPMRLVMLSLSVVLAGSVMTAAQDPSLRLSKSLQDASVRYASDTAQLRNTTNRGAMCAVLDESKQLGRAIARTLDQRRDTIAASDLDLLSVASTN